MRMLRGVLSVLPAVHAIDARWGHRSAYLSDSQTLLVHGGKIDPDGAYTYSSAPNTGETVMLDCSSAWETAAASSQWYEGTGHQQGPEVTWHTMDVVQGQVVLFGGDGGANMPIQTRNDSTWLLSAGSIGMATTSVSYKQQSTGSQPIRKNHAASSSSVDGKTVYLTGGEKADGSGLGYAEAWAVTLNHIDTIGTSSNNNETDTITFAPLPSLPTDLIHHQSISLSNGTILLLGGYIPSTSSFLPFDTVYALDPGRGSTWRRAGLTADGKEPTARRGHTATRVVTTDGSERIVLIGGVGSVNPAAAADQEDVLDDVWMLDPAQGKWQQVEEGVASGRKRAVQAPEGSADKAVGACDLSGYTSSGPADAGVYVWDSKASAWSNAFSPVVVASGTSQTSTGGGSSITSSGTSMNSEASSGRKDTDRSTATTENGSKSTGATTDDPSMTSTTNGPHTASHGSAARHVTAIAVGCTLAGLTILLAAVIFLCLMRKRRRRAKRATLLTPFGGRPSARTWGRDDDGVHTSDKLAGPWDASEKDDILGAGDDDDNRVGFAEERKGYHSSEEEEGDEGRFPAADVHYPTTRSGMSSAAAASRKVSGVFGLGKASAAPVGGGTLAAKIRQVSGRIVSSSRPGTRGTMRTRFNMLEDEDREDLLWKGDVQTGEDEDSGSEEDDGGSDHRHRSQKMLPTLPTQAGESRIASPSPVSPSYNDPFDDPLHNYYDGSVVSYAGGSSLGSTPAGGPTAVKSTSANSRSSMTESMMGGVAVQVARRVSVTTAEASYLPLKRRESWLERVAGSGVASLFRGGRPPLTPSSHAEEGFLDPTTPPALDSIREDASSLAHSSSGIPSAFMMSNFRRSMSSLVSAATANSAFLDRYGQMDIMQRDSSSGRGVPPCISESTNIARNAGLPAVPLKRDMHRPATPPRGPRPAPLRLPSHIDVGSGAARRPVKDIAASINRRGSVQLDAVPVSNMTGAGTAHTPSPYMDSPSRRITSPPPDPRGVQTIYQAVSKAPLIVANHT
ncbi:hypothetical protein QFC19_003730 [Naganishia cerealis]|uniref:Uncharacterized protein n=1 Tax=Naganishia cerealis TaxID=610337 RepID=A0ACC2VZN2_9TREE|nr:hypothetical protein QFC19_003730 [Naganishia cerealis]